MPAVSVVVVTRNQAATLPEMLRSLGAQTLAPARWELIVIDDGSTDETADILRRKAPAARVLRRKESRGLPAGCNAGLRLARGKYWARVDSDDSVSPRWLERVLGALEAEPSAVCAVPDRYETGGKNKRKVRSEMENLYSLIACGTLFKTAALRSAGGYRKFYWEEYDLYLRLRSKGEFIRVPEPLYNYRKHAASMTGNREARRKGWRELAGVWGEETLRSAGLSRELEETLR